MLSLGSCKQVILTSIAILVDYRIFKELLALICLTTHFTESKYWYSSTYWARCVEGDLWASLARDAEGDFLISDDS